EHPGRRRVGPPPHLRSPGRDGRLPLPVRDRQGRQGSREGQDERMAVRPRAQPLAVAGRAGARGNPDRVDADYLDHLRVERALSPNTLEAYGRDLARLVVHAQGAKRSLLDLRQSDLTEFIGSLRAEGLSARSVARAVHALRGFFRFAVREGRLEADPMENLRAPRAFAALPRYLTPAQVEALLAAPDVATPLGLRDRAILEVLYATGLRVSELIGLRANDLDLEVGILTCFGKGRKERLVPTGGEARRWVVRYRDEARPELAGGGSAPE